jgi:hypothetical protein
MNFISAGPSPAWLGVVAAASFGGLVLAAFASGYHLAIDPPPSKAVALVAAPAGDPDALDSEQAKPIQAGTVAEPLVDRDQAVLRAEPVDGEIVDELPAGRSVTVSAQSGEWLFVRYERDGKAHEGWTHRVNIRPDQP